MRLALCSAFVFAVMHGAPVAASAAPLDADRPDIPSTAPGANRTHHCESGNACIDAVLAAAKAGRHTDQLLLIAAMEKMSAPERPMGQSSARRPYRDADTIAVGDVDAILAAVSSHAQLDYAALPETWRVSALLLVSSKKIDEAERVLRDAIILFPTQAAFWADLGLVFGHQGKADEASAALALADTWSGNPAALRQGYAQAAHSGTNPAMRAMYAAALKTIIQNDAALQRFDASLPPVSLGPDAPEAEGDTPAQVQSGTCPRPQYPRASARYEETGRVTIAVYVGADGTLLRAKTLASSGHVELDHATLTGIAACAFKPGNSNGKAVPAWGKIQYVWELNFAG